MTDNGSVDKPQINRWDAGVESDSAVASAMNAVLEKTRQFGRMLQNRRVGATLDYGELSQVLSDFSQANVYIVDRIGLMLGYNLYPGCESRAIASILKKGAMPEEFIARMNRCHDSEIHDDDVSILEKNGKGGGLSRPEQHLMYVPVLGSGAERLGTVILARSKSPFSLRDVLLAEYLGTLVGIEILNERNRMTERRAREQLAVQMAMRALSYSEVESMRHIIVEIGDIEGVAVASRVADRVGVTRSVIVNAFRKLESAGLIESRSLGMKGTYIKVLSVLFLEELGVPAAILQKARRACGLDKAPMSERRDCEFTPVRG